MRAEPRAGGARRAGAQQGRVALRDAPRGPRDPPRCVVPLHTPPSRRLVSDEADVALAQDFTSARSSPAGSSRSSRASASPTSCASPRAARRASPSPPLAQPRLAFEPRHSIADVSHPARSHLFNPRFPDNFVYLIQDIRDADDQNLIRIFPQSVLLSLPLPALFCAPRADASLPTEHKRSSTRHCRPAGASTSTAATASVARPPSCSSPPSRTLTCGESVS